jgi:alkanesulfonate monooxygenase SsuD/methylene tetrahydromethanopterin reductase-like flavin-dependent oxidoreductase (luciferase family)
VETPVNKTVVGIGVEGALGTETVASLGHLAAAHGYESFWFNVSPREVDPIVTLRIALERSESTEIGIGVIPLDAYIPADLGRGLSAISTFSRRFIVGVGSGQMRQGALRIVEDGVTALRSAVPTCRIAVGAVGPKMLELSGRIADVVLLNWLTPEEVELAREHISIGAEKAHRPLPSIYLYLRAVQDTTAVPRIRAEMASYSVTGSRLIGIAADSRADFERQLRAYAGLCIPVLRPIPSDRKNISEWKSLIRFFAPRSDVS